MRITKRTDLAIRVLMYCAVNPGHNVTKAQIAAGVNSSENHLGHVINRLGQYGYLETTRGRRGGMQLARPTSQISVGEVFRKFETDTPVAECFSDGDNTCPLAPVCRLRDSIRCAVEAFYGHLDGVTLSDLVGSNQGLNALLGERAAA